MRQEINLLKAIPNPPLVLLPANQILFWAGGFIFFLMLFWGVGEFKLSRDLNRLDALMHSKATAKTNYENVSKRYPIKEKALALEEKLMTMESLLANQRSVIALLKARKNTKLAPFLAWFAGQLPPSIWLTDIFLNPKAGFITLKGKSLNAGSLTVFLHVAAKASLFHGFTLSKLVSKPLNTENEKVNSNSERIQFTLTWAREKS